MQPEHLQKLITALLAGTDDWKRIAGLLYIHLEANDPSKWSYNPSFKTAALKAQFALECTTYQLNLRIKETSTHRSFRKPIN